MCSPPHERLLSAADARARSRACNRTFYFALLHALRRHSPYQSVGGGGEFSAAQVGLELALRAHTCPCTVAVSADKSHLEDEAVEFLMSSTSYSSHFNMLRVRQRQPSMPWCRPRGTDDGGLTLAPVAVSLDPQLVPPERLSSSAHSALPMNQGGFCDGKIQDKENLVSLSTTIIGNHIENSRSPTPDSLKSEIHSLIMWSSLLETKDLLGVAILERLFLLTDSTLRRLRINGRASTHYKIARQLRVRAKMAVLNAAKACQQRANGILRADDQVELDHEAEKRSSSGSRDNESDYGDSLDWVDDNLLAVFAPLRVIQVIKN